MRPWLALPITGLLALLAGALGLAWLSRSDDLEARLVAESREAMAWPMTRPTHAVPPEPGTFGERLARHLPPFEQAAQEVADPEVRDAFSAMLRGERPLHETPPVFLDQLARLGPDLDGVLRATHAAGAALEPTEDGASPCPGATWLGFQQAARLTALRARLGLARGDTEAALADGLDGLALARDASVGGGLLGRMVGAAVTTMVAPVLGEILASLPAARRAAAVAKVRAIRDAFPPFEATMRHFVVEQDLMMASQDLPEAVLDRLPPRARAVVGATRDSPEATGWFHALGRRAIWRLSRAPQEERVRASALAGAAREQAFRALAARRANPFRWVERLMPPAESFGKYAARAEAGSLRLDLAVLAGAAAAWLADHGRWPASVRQLAEAGLLSSEEATRLAATRLEPSVNGALAASLALPHFDPDPPLEARVRFPAPRGPSPPP